MSLPSAGASSNQGGQPVGIITQLLQTINAGSFEILPLLLFILYVIGFICLNTHLARYPIFETNIISFNYIKASIIFILFNIPILSVSRKLAYEFKTSRKFSNLIISFYFLLFYCLIYFSYDTFIRSHLDILSSSDKVIRIRIFFCTYFPIAFGVSFYKTRNKLALAGFALVACVSIFLFCFYSRECFIILLYTTGSLIVFFFIFYNDIHNIVSYVGNKSLILPIYGLAIMSIIVSFGWFIYNIIPQIIGGGKPFTATLYLTKSEQQLLKESCALANDDVMQNQLRIIYSSEKGFYAFDNGGVIIIPVEAIKGIRVKRSFGIRNSL